MKVANKDCEKEKSRGLRMPEMMKAEADEPGGLEPSIPAASTSQLEETKDSKDLSKWHTWINWKESK